MVSNGSEWNHPIREVQLACFKQKFTGIRFRASEASFRRAQEPWYGHSSPALPTTISLCRSRSSTSRAFPVPAVSALRQPCSPAAGTSRLEGSKRHVPIVALTAEAMDGTRERCLQAGMDDHIAKPIRPKDLAEMLQRWLCPATPEPSPVPPISVS